MVHSANSEMVSYEHKVHSAIHMSGMFRFVTLTGISWSLETAGHNHLPIMKLVLPRTNKYEGCLETIM